MGNYKLLMIHASQAAVGPINEYYRENAPELQLINILDDGLLELFKLNQMSEAAQTIFRLIKVSKEFNKVNACLVTCSALSLGEFYWIRKQLDMPVVKLDLPMLEKAAELEGRIGLISTFLPGAVSSETTFQELIREKGKKGEFLRILVPGAYDSLLKGNIELHDQLVIEYVENQQRECDAYVLTQVSMAHLKDLVTEKTRKPVFASPQESLNRIRESLKTANR